MTARSSNVTASPSFPPRARVKPTWHRRAIGAPEAHTPCPYSGEEAVAAGTVIAKLQRCG